MQNFEIAAKIREVREKIGEMRDEEEIINVKIKNRFQDVDNFRDRRDKLNAEVKELSQKPKEILDKRKNVWDNIGEMNSEKKKIFRKMQPYLQRIGELRRVRDTYNHASRGTLERLQSIYQGTMENLINDDVSLKNELYLYNFLFELRDRLNVKAKADVIHKEIVRIKEEELSRFNKEMGVMEDEINDLKSESHDGLISAKDMWARRDEIREEAQKMHKSFIEAMNKVKDLKKKRWKLKKEINDLYRQIDDWKKEFKKSPQERQRADQGRRLEEALVKYKKGESLSLEELSLVLESGQLKEKE